MFNFTPCSSVSIVNFELVIVGWDGISESEENSKRQNKEWSLSVNPLSVCVALI